MGLEIDLEESDAHKKHLSMLIIRLDFIKNDIDGSEEWERHVECIEEVQAYLYKQVENYEKEKEGN